MISPKQQQVLDILKTQESMTASDIAFEMQAETKAVGAHLRRLAQSGFAHVSGWRQGKNQNQMKLYACGAGDFVPMVKKAMSQDEVRKASTKRNTYDPDAPIVQNTGWVSTIHSKDYSMNHSDHVRFMERFQPHADDAAIWMFNQPAVELLGARYD